MARKQLSPKAFKKEEEKLTGKRRYFRQFIIRASDLIYPILLFTSKEGRMKKVEEYIDKTIQNYQDGVDNSSVLQKEIMCGIVLYNRMFLGDSEFKGANFGFSIKMYKKALKRQIQINGYLGDHNYMRKSKKDRRKGLRHR